jgi:hypothetical protein
VYAPSKDEYDDVKDNLCKELEHAFHVPFLHDRKRNNNHLPSNTLVYIVR